MFKDAVCSHCLCQRPLKEGTMNRYSLLAAAALGLLVVLSCNGATGPAGPAGTPAVDKGTIAGTVADPTGAPVGGATVSTAPTTSTAQTDSMGAFTLSNIPIGIYTLIASKSGDTDGM